MLADILAKGYFPSELPPSFTTTNFAAAVMNNAAILPAGFARPRSAHLCSYSLARAGNARFRRRLSLVNPINFYALAALMVAHWRTIQQHVATSQLSKSMPVYRANAERALCPVTYDRRRLIPIQASSRASARAILEADIASFYHSIYTHSIPWALHTKAFAKANRGPGILGNDLDTLIRNSQDQQTMGIPIGPDTSFVIAECILTTVENNLRPRVQSLNGFRFVDDFELCFDSYSTAEHTLALLQEQLLEFELQLNPRKTALHLLPRSFDPEWISELRRFRIRTNTGQTGDLVSYFDLITKYLLAFPNDHVSKYALSRMTSFDPRPENVELYVSLLCNVAVAEPGSIREVVQSLLFLTGRGHNLDRQLLQETFNLVITNSAPLGHHYEVSWLLWCSIQLNLALRPPAIAALATDNSVVGILALDAHSRGLAPNLDLQRLHARMTADDLLQDQWLLAYEANVHGWLPGQVDHVAADRDFGFLKRLGVQFYVP